MASVAAQDVTVEFPVYGTAQRSLKTSLLKAAIGGAVATTGGDNVVVRALEGINFNFTEGDRIGIVGHNGSGKSTLLRVIAGAYQPQYGSVEVTGSIASMISISLGLDIEATGEENIFLLGAILGRSPSEMREAFDEICNFAELGEFVYLPVRTYSHGMLMRLVFTVATSVPADIVLMDEWLSVGDDNFAAKAQARLGLLLDRAKILFLASHSEDLVKRNCNWLLRLAHGKIVSLDRL